MVCAKGDVHCGNHPKLGNLVPNKIAMYDDGTHGDQKRGTTSGLIQQHFRQGPSSSMFIPTVAKKGNGKAWMFHILGVSRSKLKTARKSFTDPSSPSGKFTCTLIHGIPTPLGMSLLLGLYSTTLKKNEQVKDYLRQAKSKPLTSSHDR